MKIWGELPKILGVYNRQKSVGKVDKTGGVSGKKDVVSISTQAKDYQVAMKALKDIPDIRIEKVSEVADRVDSGSYDVNGKDIAEKIVNSIFDKKA